VTTCRRGRRTKRARKEREREFAVPSRGGRAGMRQTGRRWAGCIHIQWMAGVSRLDKRAWAQRRLNGQNGQGAHKRRWKQAPADASRGEAQANRVRRSARRPRAGCGLHTAVALLLELCRDAMAVERHASAACRSALVHDPWGERAVRLLDAPNRCLAEAILRPYRLFCVSERTGYIWGQFLFSGAVEFMGW